MPSASARVPIRARRARGRALVAAAVLASAGAGGAPLQPGDILVTDFTASKLFVIDPDNGAPTEIASGVLLDAPVGVAARDDGFAFVTNPGSQFIVRVDPAPIPPNPVQVLLKALANPRGIAIDPSGDVFVSSPSTDQILRVDSVTGVATGVTFSGLVLFPTGLVREASGDLVVADSSTLPIVGGPKLVRIDLPSGDQTLLAAAGMLMVPRDVEIDPAGGFLVVDSGARKVIRVDDTIPFDSQNPTANQTEWAACPQEFVSPRGIAVEADGDVLVSDFSAKQVFVIHPTPTPPPRVCIPLINASPLVGPWDVAVTPAITPFDPTMLLVADAATDKIYRVDPEDGSSVDLWPGLAFSDPVAAIRDLSQDYFVLERDKIHRVTPSGVPTLVATITPGPAPVDLTGIAIDANGELLVTDAANDRLLRVIPASGQQFVIADDDFTPSAPLGAPAGLALDRNGTVLIANRGDAADTPAIPTGVVRVNPGSGTAAGVVTNAQFVEIVAVAVDRNGDYLISDRGTDTVWRLLASIPAPLNLFPISIGNDITSLRGLAIDLNRSVVVGNQGAKEILRIDPTSGVQTEIAPAPVFSGIEGIALDRDPSPPPLDSDSDGILEDADNCPEIANPDQLDLDADGQGDVCDADVDGDGDPDLMDNCRLIANPNQEDSNHDGFGNRCDADYASAGNPNLGDLVVSAPDFSRFRAAFGTSANLPDGPPDPAYSAEIDFNSDGGIGAADFSNFKSSFQHPPGPSGLACRGTIPCPP